MDRGIFESPAEAGWFMPAEWRPHTRCWMAWPTHKDWKDLLEPARKQVAAVAQAIAEFEPVRMISPAASSKAAAKACGGKVEVVALPIDDCWARDTCPTFLVNDKGECAGTAWRFNGWGEKYRPYADDVRLARRILGELQLLTFEAPLVVEGGNLCADGEGTLLTSETAILDPKRNPGMKRDEAEKFLRDYLGVKKVIWLPGNEAEAVTRGHVDGMACFCRPGVAIAEVTEDKEDPEYGALLECRKTLCGYTDARGREIDVLTLTRPRLPASVADDEFCSSYVNFYIANGAIIMPAFGERRADEAARKVVAEAFQDHRVVQLRIDDIAAGGGGIHCITQQQPAV